VYCAQACTCIKVEAAILVISAKTGVESIALRLSLARTPWPAGHTESLDTIEKRHLRSLQRLA
jgi:hypothetical protein